MRIKVLLVLGMVLGTLGSAVERNGTIGDVSNTTENIIHVGNVTMDKKILNVEEIGQREEIKSNLKNKSEEIAEKLSLADDTFNNSIGLETPVSMIDVNNSKVVDELKHNSDEIVERFSSNNGSSNDSNNIEISTPMDDSKHSKSDNKQKNIILILSEGTDDGSSWEKLKKNYSFAVEGFFQNCEKDKKTDASSKITLTDDDDCDCHNQPNYIIKDLIIYARDIKGMNAAIVCESNLTTSTDSSFDNLHHHHHNHQHKVKLIGDIDNVAMSDPIHRHHSQSSNDSRSLHIDNQLASSVSSIPTKTESSRTTKTHSPIHRLQHINDDSIWAFINWLIKVRWNFVRDLFDAMHKHPVFNRIRGVNPRWQSLHYPAQQSTTLIELITNTLMNPQLIHNENGFLLIVVTPHNELPAVYKIIDDKLTTKDSLVIISGVHATDETRLIPYLANGLGSNNFKNLENICKLSSAIKLVLGPCQGVCEDEDFTSSSIPAESLIPKKRVARSDEDETPMEEEKSVEKEDTETEPGPDDTEEGGENNYDDRPKSSAMSFYCKNDSLALTISIVISICTAFILHS